MRVMALLAAFCSQKAWSVKSSSILLSTTFLTHSGSVGSCSLRMVFSLTGAKIVVIEVKGKRVFYPGAIISPTFQSLYLILPRLKIHHPEPVSLLFQFFVII